MSASPSLSTASRCTHTTADGRRCAALVFPGHAALCHQHLRQRLDQLPPSEDTAPDILSSVQNFQSATAINDTLGKILTLLAAGRIKRQDAIAMAYICQLLLQTLKGFKEEMRLTTYQKTWVHDFIDLLNTRTPLENLIFPSAPSEEDEQIHQPEEKTPAESPDKSPGALNESLNKSPNKSLDESPDQLPQEASTATPHPMSKSSKDKLVAKRLQPTGT